MPRLIKPLLASLIFALATTLPAGAFETKAKAAYVVDLGTGTVLLNKDADTPLPPASMSKLMTLYMAFEALRRGKNNAGLDMDQMLPVSAHANGYTGSTLFLKQGERVKVEDLIRGIIVLSGNDACAVIAEALSPDGTEAGFARLMTQRAQALGMTNSTFGNSNGWPHPAQRMSMRDLGLLATRLIEDFPEFYPMFSQKEFLFDPKESANRFNRNPLLKLGIGADGLKTGHTNEAGYGLTGSAKQGNRRIVFVLSGLNSAVARAQESEAIVNWAFRHFAQRPVAKKGDRIALADVWMGNAPSVGLVPAHDVSVLLPVLGDTQIAAEVVYRGPIRAPVVAGDPLGELILHPEGMEQISIPLVAEMDVPEGGFMARVSTAAKLVVARIAPDPV